MVTHRLSYEDLMDKYESDYYEQEKPKGFWARLFK
jgi:hypothetical protein